MKRANVSELLWPISLVAGGAAMGVVLLCIAPFAAVATLAARTLTRRSAALAIVATWAFGQLDGFGRQRFPHDASTIAWGVAILIASLAAGTIATRVRVTALAFLAAFAAFELVLFAWSLVTGERGAFAPWIVAQVFAGNLFGAAVLGAIRVATTTVGAAREGAVRRALR